MHDISSVPRTVCSSGSSPGPYRVDSGGFRSTHDGYPRWWCGRGKPAGSGSRRAQPAATSNATQRSLRAAAMNTHSGQPPPTPDRGCLRRARPRRGRGSGGTGPRQAAPVYISSSACPACAAAACMKGGPAPLSESDHSATALEIVAERASLSRPSPPILP